MAESIEKSPGEKWGGIIRLTYKGPGQKDMWVGAGLKVDHDYWNIPSYWWAAALVDFPTCTKDTTLEVNVEDTFPEDIPFGKSIDVVKVMAWRDITKVEGDKEAIDALIVDKETDGDVYITPEVEIKEVVQIISAKPYTVK